MSQSRLLTDEEKHLALVEWRERNGLGPDFYIDDTAEVYLPVQDAKTEPLVRADERRKMAEWLINDCDDASHHSGARLSCSLCLSELYMYLREGRAPWA